LQSPFSYRVEKKLFHRADRIVATSRAIANELCSYQIDPKTVGILGNGVDTDEFYPDPNAGIEIPPYIFASGRLIPGKGWEDLLKCARFVLQKIPQVRFLLAGSGYLEKSLKAEAERLDVSANVFWLGHVNDRVRLADLYRRASVFVNPSQYEGLSTSLLEAMACARPIVATSIGGTADLLRNGENALLVESQNPKTMAEGILQILARPDLGSRLGDGALETIRKDYSWRVVSQKYLAEYQRLLEKRVRQ
jgi:glycosyltransferase involved in cell wall biosynthesis